MIILTMYPVLRFNITKIRNFPDPPYKILDSIALIYVICMIVKLPHDVTHVTSGITYIMMDMGGDLYNKSLMVGQANEAGVISSIPTIYINITTEIVILIVYYNIKKIRRKLLTVGAIIALIISPLGSIANGQRTGIFDTLIVAIGTYFLFAPVFTVNIRKTINKIGIVVVIMLCIPVVALTQSRFSKGGRSVEYSLASYMGQENLNFDLYAFDNNGIRYGDRVFPLFKKFLGYKNVPSDFWERRDKYSQLKINDEVFIGYVGDFLLDFGPLVSTIMFLIFAFVCCRLTKAKNGRLRFYQLLLIQYILTIGLQGGLRLFPFADNYGLKIIAYGLLYVYLFLYDKRPKISQNRNFSTDIIANN